LQLTHIQIQQLHSNHNLKVRLEAQAEGSSSWTFDMTSQMRNIEIKSSMGSFVIELYWNHAPRTCQNFFTLCTSGHYNNVIFHRIINDFMIQGGDPTGTGRGGKSIYGAKFDDEISKDLKHVGAGILSMANSGPNTNGSQFFITLAPTPHLDGKHTIFGRIQSGMKVIHRMGLVQTDKTDRPVDDVKIFSASPHP
jgi:peptidyl-prolyl cis-trans isomerase-like 1